MRFDFVVRSGKEVGRTVQVATGQSISLGRLKGCDVVVDDEAASRRHCTITGRESVCVLADLQSANGTFVNDKRIATIELQPADSMARAPRTNKPRMRMDPLLILWPIPSASNGSA